MTLASIFNAIQLLTVRNLRQVFRNNLDIILVRSAITSIGMAILIFCLRNIPLSVYALITELSPLFTVFMSALFLKECIKPIEFALCISALFGTVLVIQPPIVKSKFWRQTDDEIKLNYLWTGLAFCGPLYSSLNYVLLRKMSRKTIPVPLSVANFSQGVGCLIVGAISQMFMENLRCFTLTDVLFLIPLTILTIANQSLRYYANKFEKSPIVALILTVKVPVLILADLILFPNESSKYNLLQYLGGIVVFASTVSLMVFSYVRKLKEDSAEKEKRKKFLLLTSTEKEKDLKL